MKKARLVSLLLCFCLVFALLPLQALAATTVNKIVITMTAPKVGKVLPTDAKVPATVSTQVTQVEWQGRSEGATMDYDTEYTVVITVEIKPEKDAKFTSKKDGINATVNDKKASVERVSNTLVKVSYTFPLVKSQATKDEEKYQAQLAKRYSLAEADANYPLGQPLTILVSEDTVNVAEVNTWQQWSGWHTALRGTSITNVLGKGFYTLDGEFIDTSGAPRINKNYSDTLQTYRPTRVVYDLYRKIDFSLAEQCNVKEFWLSPKCDIQGILDNIGREQLPSDWGGDRDRFGTYDHILFIPDSVYPNGPTYSGGTIPGCRVMLYSGDDVYAAAEKGKEAARDWCTDHSFTYKYASPDRRCSFASCISDERFFYSCSKCGLCERNPNHTFVGGWDQHEGQYGAHSFNKLDVSDEHFLGVNANGDRVYVKTCSVCGKDKRQVDIGETYEYAVATKGQISREQYQYALNQTKANWAEGGSFYKWSLEATPEKDTTRSFAVSKDTYVWATVSPWAKNDVQAAADSGLIDKALLGDHYTYTINRQQFASIAVKMAEQMLGKPLPTAPAGTFTDTDSEYARKAYAAGITTGVTATTFDPYAPLNRQQMATFIYRALQYVKQNSDTEYTVYTSKLGRYADAGQVADWANQSMAFMNALGLINGTTDTTLAPTANCTIEQALIVAYRSLDAGSIGWYQCVKSVKGFGTYSDLATHYVYGDRVWITSSSGHCTDPYGKPSGVDLRDFYPIKDR